MVDNPETKLGRAERIVRQLVSALACCISLAGCALFVPGVDDLRLVDLQPVEVGTLDLHDTWGDLRPKLPPTDVVGKLTVATSVDIHEISERSGLNVWHELTICKTGASVFDWPGVYYKGVDINTNSTSEEIESLYRDRAAAHKDDAPYVYEIYFVPRSTRSEPKGVGQPSVFEPYDFARQPLELCLKIGGGNMAGGYFVSNVIMVPSVEIGRAFHEGQR